MSWHRELTATGDRLEEGPGSKGAHRHVFIGLIVLVLLISFGVRFVLLPNFRMREYDEGLHALLAQLLSRGYQPYNQIFVSYPPFFVWSLQLPWQIWKTLDAIQWVMVCYSLCGVCAVAYIAYTLNGWLAGVLAALILSFAPQYLTASMAVMTEVPSVALAAVAMALVIAAYRVLPMRYRRALLFASGVALWASLMLKVLCPYVLGLVPLAIILFNLRTEADRAGWMRRVILDGLAWGVGLVVPTVVTLAFYDVGALFRQVVAFRFNSRLSTLEETTDRPATFSWFFLVENWPISAAMALAAVLRRRLSRELILIWLWLLLGILFLIVHVPLRFKHLPQLLPPMAILAGIGLSEGWHRLSDLLAGKRRLLSVGLVLLSAGLTAGLPMMVVAGLSEYGPVGDPLDYYNSRVLSKLLKKYTAPDDCVVTDYPPIPFFADRRVPPFLSELSYTRLQSGDVTADDLIRITSAEACQSVFPIAFRLKRHASDFLDWANGNFLKAWQYHHDRLVYLAQPLTNPAPSLALTGQFDGKMELQGADIMQRMNGKSPEMYVSLYWRAAEAIRENYTILVRVYDSANRLVENGDHEPYGGAVSTRLFPPNKTVKETIRVDLSDLQPGQYRIFCGLFSGTQSQRLSLANDNSGENLLYVGAVQK